MVVQSLIMDKHQLKISLGKLFQKMDDDQSGKLRLFRHDLHVRRVKPTGLWGSSRSISRTRRSFL